MDDQIQPQDTASAVRGRAAARRGEGATRRGRGAEGTPPPLPPGPRKRAIQSSQARAMESGHRPRAMESEAAVLARGPGPSSRANKFIALAINNL